MEVDHAFGQTAPQFINAGNQCFEVVAIFNAGVFRDFFEAAGFQLGRVRARACARYGVLVVGEEMKGLVNCNFLPGSARRLELGTVSAEPLSRAYWSQKLRPLGETVGLSRARTSGESPDSTQAGRGPQWPIQLAAISAHPAAMVGTGMPKLRGRTGNEP